MAAARRHTVSCGERVRSRKLAPWKIRHRAPLGKLSREAPIVVNGLLLAGPASFNFVDRSHGPQTTRRGPLTQPHLSKKAAAVARLHNDRAVQVAAGTEPRRNHVKTTSKPRQNCGETAAKPRRKLRRKKGRTHSGRFPLPEAVPYSGVGITVFRAQCGS